MGRNGMSRTPRVSLCPSQEGGTEFSALEKEGLEQRQSWISEFELWNLPFLFPQPLVWVSPSASHSITSLLSISLPWWLSREKESVCNVADLGSMPGLGRSPGEGKGCPLQYSGLSNSMGCVVCGVAESDTTGQLSLYLSPCL